MEHNPISMGDVAYSMASDERISRQRLEFRVATLEQEVEAIKVWSNELADRLNDALIALASFVQYEPLSDFTGDDE